MAEKTYWEDWRVVRCDKCKRPIAMIQVQRGNADPIGRCLTCTDKTDV